VASSIGKDYLAVEGQGTLIINAAVGQNLPPAPNILWDDALEKIRFIPIAREFYPTVETCFMGWLPGTNLMLARVNTW
jgi:hypothetical protein